ncbi:MAG TPA: alginate lyase family protein [Gammaproteobacteria bacterium]
MSGRYLNSVLLLTPLLFLNADFPGRIITDEDTPPPTVKSVLDKPLKAPPGYYQKIVVKKDAEYSCPQFPKPYTGPLVFAFEGDDGSGAYINKKSASRYLKAAVPIRELESLSASITRDFIRGSGVAARDCLIDLLYAWAKVNALQHREINPVGQAMRKWALAATGSHYLQITQLNSGLPAADARKRKLIEKWFARQAAQVVAYYSGRDSAKADNHDYWAAWAVMVTAVNLQDRELYDWAVNKYRAAVRQIDRQGYLPNEIKRKSRALTYQNFALQPLVMLAVFAESNDDFLPKEHAALERLAEKVVAGINNPRIFQSVTGKEQKMDGMITEGSLAWIPVWRAYFDPHVVAPLDRRINSFKSARLGGNTAWLFKHKKQPKPKTRVARKKIYDKHVMLKE